MWLYGLDRAGQGQRQVADACECGNEPSGSVKCGEFLDRLQTSQLLKKDSAPWSKKVRIFLLLLVSMQCIISRTIGPSFPSTTFQSLQGIFDLLSQVPQVSAPYAPNESVLWPQYLFLCSRWFVVSAHSSQITLHKSRASKFRNSSPFWRLEF